MLKPENASKEINDSYMLLCLVEFQKPHWNINC